MKENQKLKKIRKTEVEVDGNRNLLKQFASLCYSQWTRKEDIGLHDDNFYMAYLIVETFGQEEKVVAGAILHEVFPSPWQYWLFLSFLLVHPEYRSQGLGSELLDVCKAETKIVDNKMKMQGNPFKLDEDIIDFGKICPTNTVFVCQLGLYAERWNDQTRKFYEHRGFEFVEEEEGVYEDDDHDGIACVYIWEPIDDDDDDDVDSES